MFTHFQWKPLFASDALPGWSISFFFQGAFYKAIYHKDGSLEWTSLQPPEQHEKQIISQIHELMLFHVYD
ncbi:MAG: YheE family protein [Ectobacillus sp.]